VEVNRPPVGGTLAVSPSVGRAFQTNFALTASGWYDEHLPLSYAYSALQMRLAKEAFLCDVSNRTSCKVSEPITDSCCGAKACNHP
jgi:hypothetical protein